MPLRVLIRYCWLGFVVLWWTWALFNKTASRGGPWRGKVWAMRLAMIAVVIAVLWFERLSGLGAWVARPGHFLLQQDRFWQWAGLALCLAGFLFAIWARAYLGGNWGIPMSLRREHELVTRGPYARVRHPIYSGLLLAGLGTVLARTGDRAGAIRQFAKAIEDNPKYAVAHRNLASEFAAAGDLEQAIDAFVRVGSRLGVISQA